MPKGIRRRPLTDTERFWPKVDKRGPDDCWEWLAARNPQGYGWFWSPTNRTMELAHRASFVLAGGALPSGCGGGRRGAAGLVVRHSCDNPPCVNPAHLLVGSQLQNMQECFARERRAAPSGERNPRAKLTQAQVEAIKADYTGRYGEKMAIARSYGISSAQVSKILLGQSWR